MIKVLGTKEEMFSTKAISTTLRTRCSEAHPFFAINAEGDITDRINRTQSPEIGELLLVTPSRECIIQTESSYMSCKTNSH